MLVLNGNDGSQAMQCIPIDAFGIHEHMAAVRVVLIVRSQVHSSMNDDSLCLIDKESRCIISTTPSWMLDAAISINQKAEHLQDH